MIALLVGFMFSPELFELLNNLVIFADLLIDGKQHGIEREYYSQQNPYQFSFHNGPPHKDERTTKERGPGGLLPSGSCRQANLSEGWDGVRPGLDCGADCFIRVRGEGDPVAAEVHEVQFAVGVVAPDCGIYNFLPGDICLLWGFGSPALMDAWILNV